MSVIIKFIYVKFSTLYQGNTICIFHPEPVGALSWMQPTQFYPLPHTIQPTPPVSLSAATKQPKLE
jgi:hypothetical protein